MEQPRLIPILVGGATVSIAELRLHLPDLRSSVTARQGIAGVAAVLGIYVTTALVHTAPAIPANVLIYSLAAITWCALGDRCRGCPRCTSRSGSSSRSWPTSVCGRDT
jgi:hypothetical protein